MAGSQGGRQGSYIHDLFLTEQIENIYRRRPWMEDGMTMWIKDAAAGMGLLAFIAGSFALAQLAQAVIAGA